MTSNKVYGTIELVKRDTQVTDLSGQSEEKESDMKKSYCYLHQNEMGKDVLIPINLSDEIIEDYIKNHGDTISTESGPEYDEDPFADMPDGEEVFWKIVKVD